MWFTGDIGCEGPCGQYLLESLGSCQRIRTILESGNCFGLAIAGDHSLGNQEVGTTGGENQRLGRHPRRIAASIPDKPQDPRQLN